MRRLILLAAFGFTTALAPTFAAEPSADSNVVSSEVEARVEQILKQLTNEDKCEFLGGIDEFYTKPVERLNVPRLKFMDGPLGPRNDGPTVAYPSGISLAATWNTQLASREASAMGKDARARGCNVLLGPAVNIYRVPNCGRNFEYFGEDPYLASRLAVSYIQALQAEGVAACIKHYAVNNQETNRWTVNAVIDERTLHEIYLPAFRAAVQEAGVWSIMSAYNRVNGPYCTAHDYLQNELLRNQWGFRGVVMSDWGATHETLNCMLGGLDLEMPSGRSLNPQTVMPLLADGRIPQSVLDDKVRRLLRLAVQTGVAGRTLKAEGVPLNTPESEAAALAVAREGIVLLKNSGILPLDASKPMRVLLLGQALEHHGGGSAWAAPTHTIALADAMRAIVNENVELATITPDLAKQMEAAKEQGTYLPLPATNNQPGVVAQYYANPDLRGQPAVTQVETKIDHDWGSGSPVQGVGPARFSVRWNGKIRPDQTGTYAFFARGDDGYRIKIDGKELASQWNDQGATTRRYVAKLEAAKTYDLVVEYYNNAGLAEFRFSWSHRPELFTPEQMEQIKSADVVIAVAGFRGSGEGEGNDRSYALPDEQNDLLRSVVNNNKNTVVVLNTGGGVDMSGFADGCGALIHAFYPGQLGPHALAEILTGEVNPSGRLPISLETKWEDNPASGSFPGDAQTTEYREGIFVGYRHYDHKNIAPRYPFGFGLSYTSFDMTNLRVLDDTSAGIRIAVDVANTGQRSGSQVVQAYVSAANPTLIRPVRELKGFGKVSLKPGERQTVTITLPADAFAYYDTPSHGWKTVAGEYLIQVGEHSRSLPLNASVRR